MRLGRFERDIYTLPLLLLIIVPLFYYLTTPEDVVDTQKKRTPTHKQKPRIFQALKPIEETEHEIPEVPVQKPDTDFLLKSNLIDATVIRRSKTGWERDDGVCKSDNVFTYLELNSLAGMTPIYVHPGPSRSKVSWAVITGSVWEEEGVEKLYNLLKDHPDMQFIDIGANIGGYGLTMAKLGRKVLMIEPQLTHLQKLCLSVREGNFHDVYILHNALSSKRGKVGIIVPEDGLFDNAYIGNVKSRDEETAHALLLDDLLEVFKFTKVAIKLDVSGHEAEVLRGAEKFFNKVDVKYVLVEWGKDKRKENKGIDIINFMTRFKMAPYDPVAGIALVPKRSYRWLRPVLWIKTN